MTFLVLYRYQRFALSASGISPVKVRGVENVDCSEIIGGHQEYSCKLRDVLRVVKLDDGAFTYHLPVPSFEDLNCFSGVAWGEEEEVETGSTANPSPHAVPSPYVPTTPGSGRQTPRTPLERVPSEVDNTVLY